MPKQTEVMEAEPDETAVARREDPGQVLDMIERLASNPDVDVEKLKGLMDLQERMVDRQAEQEFWAAFARMQTALPEVTEHGQIVNNKGKVVSTYATFEDIMEVVKPILHDHGFALSFRFGEESGKLKTTGILAHASGHKESTTFTGPIDDSGYKNLTQGTASAHSYGKRYTASALLNLTTRGEDDDGQRAGDSAEPPDGYDEWIADLDSLADEGTEALEKAWPDQPDEFRRWLTQHERQRWNEIKRRAAQASS